MRGGARLGCAAMGLALAMCAAAPARPACPLPGQIPMTELKMYFGRDIPGGGFVDDAAWSDYAANVLTPAFPEGFTVYQTLGQWRYPKDGRVKRERSFVVEHLGPLKEASVNAAATAYKKQFRQQSVLVVTSETCASF